MSRKILVIKLGALGDFIYALGPMAAIRKAHPDDHITLLTTAPYEKMARACGYFNDIMVDKRPKTLDILGWWTLRKRLNKSQFDRVYDLQNNDRTALYFKLFAPRPEWFGAVLGASHRNTSPDRSTRHAFYGHAQTLALAGIKDVTLDPLLWMSNAVDDIKYFGLKAPYVLLIAGCSPQHPEKRWPVASFRVLAGKLLRQGITPVVIGTTDEAATNAAIARGLDVIDLTGKTALFDIPLLARHAVAAIGNDTGPMHMAAVTGCPLVMLFSNTASNITLHAAPFPDGTPHVANLAAGDIGDIKVGDVFQKFLDVSTATMLVCHKSC